MFNHIYNIMYSKTYHIYDIIFKTFINDNSTSLENNEYICPDYIADETTITENIYCEYDNSKFNNISTNCIDYILFFIVINIFYIALFILIERSFFVFNSIITKLFLQEDLMMNNDDNSDEKNNIMNNSNINTTDTTDTTDNIILKDKDEIEEFFFNYSEIIKIQQYLNKDNNLDKVLYFYKESSNYLQQTKDILNDKYRNIFLNKEKFLNYYKIEHDNTSITNNVFLKFIKFDDTKNLYTSCRDKTSVNLSKLYETEQIMVDKSLFDIYNNKKYFPLKKDQLCYLTNLSKLNVIIWLIEIGFYDYLEKHI